MRTIRGFTLIELLVVIAVIALLASLLMPVIGLVRSSARSAVCAANQRQFHLATLAFTDEHDGQLICMSGGNVWRWFRDIMPYLTHNPGSWNDNPTIVAEVMSVSRCPSFAGVVRDPASTQVEWDSRGYAINARPLTPDDWSHTLLDWWWWSGAGGPARIIHSAQVTRAADRFLITDGDWGTITGPNWFNDWKGTLLAGEIDQPTVWGFSAPGNPTLPRHRGTRNVLLFDGSCHAAPLADTSWLVVR